MGESQIKELNLFVTGVGNVGSKLLEQIDKQTDYLKENLRLKFRVRAISNSRNSCRHKDLFSFGFESSYVLSSWTVFCVGFL